MPDKKISELTSQTGAGLLDADVFVTVDTDDTTMAASGTDKKITRTELVAGLWTRASFSDADHTTAVTTRYLAQTGSMSAARTVTLPAANAVPAGAAITIADEHGSPTETNQIRILAAGTDTIDKVSGSGATSNTTYAVIRVPFGSFTFRSDGSSNWTTVNRTPGVDVQKFTTSGSNTWRKPFGLSHARGILIGGGGGGGGGNRTNAGNASGGGGGGQAAGVCGFTVPLADLGATETVTIGAGGGKGAGRTTSGTGNAGSAGGVTHFGSSSKWVAQGGGAGTAGVTAGSATSSSAGAGTTVGATGGGGDGNSGGTRVTGTPGSAGAGSATGSAFPCIAPGGGGGGGAYNDTTGVKTAYAGQVGGKSSPGVLANAAGLTGGTAAATSDGGVGMSCYDDSSGNVFFASSTTLFGGAGGGGGGGVTNAAGKAGGQGGLYGGGGGGGAGSSGFNSGAGGDGAQGAALIVSF